LETPGREREREVIKKSLTTSTTTTTREDLLISFTIIRAGSSQRSELVKLLAQASSWRQLCIYYTFRYLSLSLITPTTHFIPLSIAPLSSIKEKHTAEHQREREIAHTKRGGMFN
jgi:hypothetical protein